MVENKILKNPKLFDLLIKEVDKNAVGEVQTKKAIMLSCCSVWVNDMNINTIVGGDSSVGKDYIVKSIMGLFPKSCRVSRTRITPAALNYWHMNEADWSWDGKILYLADISNDVLNSPVLKVMTTEGSTTTIVINGKAVDLEIKGKPNLMVSTAEAEPCNEILNRFNLISLDESREQTGSIMDYTAQRYKTNSKVKYSEKVLHALKLLKKVDVVIPYADKLTKFFPRHKIKMRRFFPRFLDLICASAALHQFQREVDSEGNVIADGRDYKITKNIIENIGEATISGKTATEKRYLAELEKVLNGKYLSVKEIYDATHYKSIQSWYDILQKLVEKGILVSQERTNTSTKSCIEYSLVEKTEEMKIHLLEFKELLK